MKKKTQKRLFAVILIVIFGASSLSFAHQSFFGAAPQSEFQPLDSFVIEGEVPPQTEQVYVQNGFTWMRFYYTDTTSQSLMSFVDILPSSLTTPSGQTQMIVQKIQSTDTRAEIGNLNAFVTLDNVTQDAIFGTLCRNLILTPTECAFSSQAAQNSTQA